MSDYQGIRYTDPLIGSHIRRYRENLEAGSKLFISSLIESYRLMSPSLHRRLTDKTLDQDAINYSATRLPPLIFFAKEIIMAPSVADFKAKEYDILSWERVFSRNRRRLMYWHPDQKILACLINSDSDIDDLVNNLIAYQIEHQKLGLLLNSGQENFITDINCQLLGITENCHRFFSSIFGDHWQEYILSTKNPLDFQIKLLPKTEESYLSNCQKWWQDISSHTLIFELNKIPIYFVSSNSHSLVNVIGGFLNQKQNYIFDFISQSQPDFYQQWFESKTRNNQTRVSDFIYHIANTFLTANPEFVTQKTTYETSLGIKNIKSTESFPTDVQIIPVNSLAKSPDPDPNLKLGDTSKLAQSKALIVNIQYPLGIAARFLLNQILDYFVSLKAIYVIGKAAILNGNLGDIQIPEVVFDEITNNIYHFDNLFNHYFSFNSYIENVLTNQKAVCVYGTFLENKSQLQNYISTNMNIIEMENGNYLAAIVEHTLLNHQKIASGNIYNMDKLPFDFGIINYASDNPLVQNLGQEPIGFRGIESTYLATLAVVQRIIDLETGVK